MKELISGQCFADWDKCGKGKRISCTWKDIAEEVTEITQERDSVR
jgi:hypothetical protein